MYSGTPSSWSSCVVAQSVASLTLFVTVTPPLLTAASDWIWDFGPIPVIGVCVKLKLTSFNFYHAWQVNSQVCNCLLYSVHLTAPVVALAWRHWSPWSHPALLDILQLLYMGLHQGFIWREGSQGGLTPSENLTNTALDSTLFDVSDSDTL